MRIVCVAELDKVYHPQYLESIKELDNRFFPGCGDEFRSNRIWFAAVENKKVLGYSAIALIPDQKLIFFSRAAVVPEARGKGIHKRLIKARLTKAKKFAGKYHSIITYVVLDNVISGNNLIKHGFRLYTPQQQWAGDVIYFARKLLHPK